MALAHVCASLSPPLSPTIYVPAGISPLKEARLRQAGATLLSVGTDCVEAELAARAAAKEGGACYVSPYNDPDVVAGQATLGLELMCQLRRGQLDAVFVPVGGGGLIAGVAQVLKVCPAFTPRSRRRLLFCAPPPFSRPPSLFGRDNCA